MVRQPGMQSLMQALNAAPKTLLPEISCWLATLPAINITPIIAIIAIAIIFCMLPMINYLDR
ncbi:hypothetical protein Scep_004118 [Stephania cephalantha]|uniref:Uncharacterized protein n=1 Tax=Stephania cephalantha TaxID=152367 RepID=A0AAP0KUP0_9MAGN